MKKKSKIVTALVLALSLMALAAVPVFAGTDSKTFGAGTIANSSASLSVSSTQATASTTNRAGVYAYAKATLNYTNGDWDANWSDGQGTKTASVSKLAGVTVKNGTGTHEVRAGQAYNSTPSYVTSTSTLP